MIQLAGVGKKLDSGWLFRGVDLDVPSNQSAAIVGPSGSGKTVLLKLIAGLIAPDEGRVRVDSPELGMLFQHNALFDSLTVLENLLFPLREKKGITGDEALSLARRHLEWVGLSSTSDPQQSMESLMPSQLSGGMQKRLGIARSLIMQPGILLYDDPTAGLDPGTARQIEELIGRMHADTSFVVVTSDMELAHRLCDRTYLLDQGRLVELGGKSPGKNYKDSTQHPGSQRRTPPAGPPPVIEFSGCSKRLGKRQILDQLSFDVRRGEILFILGKSGTGKSVTLKHIIGKIRPDSGKVQVFGDPVETLDLAGLSSLRRRCGMVLQQPALLDSMTVFENIAVGLRSLGTSEIPERVSEAMKTVRLDEGILKKRPSELSFGMKKRVSLARTLVMRPEVLLLDEPTTGLDPINSKAITQMIFDLSRKRGVTSVVVSHDVSSALELADRILVIDEGRTRALGSPDQVRGYL